MKNNQAFIVILFLSISFACTKKPETELPRYDFIHPAYLNLEFKNVSDSTYVSSWHWQYILRNEIKTDSFLLLRSGSKLIPIKVNKPQRVQFYFNDKRFDFFLIPTDTSYVSMDFAASPDSIQPVFRGKLSLMNRYYLAKYDHFDTWDFFYPRTMFTRSAKDAIELCNDNDDLTFQEIDFLNDFKSKNPKLSDWFYEFEKQNLVFQSSYFKINSIFYRDVMLGIKDSIPADYYGFIDSMDINSEISVLTDNYSLYLYDLLSWKFRSIQNVGGDTNENSKQDKSYYNLLFNFINDLDSPGKELFSLYNLFFYSKHNPANLQFIDTLRNNIVTPEYLHLLDSIDANKYQLRENTKAHDFYLQDINGKFQMLKDFQGKVVLLNFWSLGCIPCFKEFPYEDTLALKLENDDFQLINICMTSKVEGWEKRVEGHTAGIVHLFAKDNWNEVLKSSYKVYGYPTFILIDKNGNIANANPPRPSNPELIVEIRKLLEVD